MMKYLPIVLSIWFLTSGCLKEKPEGENCSRRISFVMKDVPYVYSGEEAVGYRPYYTFVEQLDLYVVAGQKPVKAGEYGFDFCREHPVITERLDLDASEVLFAANVFDSKMLHWDDREGELHAYFSIIDHEEPPMILAASAKAGGKRDSVGVELRLLVSRLEIKLVNPPEWVRGLEVTVDRISETVAVDYSLGEATYIRKQLLFDRQGADAYLYGVNTFPSYQDNPAIVKIDLLGAEPVAPILVDNDRMHLWPGIITRLDLIFDDRGKVAVEIEVEGKWEIVNGGSIII